MNVEEIDSAASLHRHSAVLGHVHLVENGRQVHGHRHVDMRAILQALLAAGNQGYLRVEVLPLPDLQGAVKDSIQTVRAIVASSSGRS